jgi:hypothetical protein
LRRFLKLRYLGQTSLQCTIARQKSSLRWLREGVPLPSSSTSILTIAEGKTTSPLCLLTVAPSHVRMRRSPPPTRSSIGFWELLMSALALLILRSSASQDWICRTLDNRSRRPKFGRSLKSYPWTRLLVPMGLQVASTGRVGRSSGETFFELLMLSPTWIVVASII